MRISGLAANGKKQPPGRNVLGAPARKYATAWTPASAGSERFRCGAYLAGHGSAGAHRILSSAQGDASIYTAISLGVRGYLLKGNRWRQPGRSGAACCGRR